MRTYSIPSLEHLLSTPSKPYPLTKTFAEHKHEPFVSLHTSGTTGFPKPILWTHDWANSCAHCLRMPGPTPNLPTATYVYGSKNRVLLPFPPFHASGVIGQTLFAICTGTTLVTPAFSPDPAQGVRLIANTLDFLGKGNIHLVALPPPHMEYLATQPELLDRIAKNVDLAMWGGGDISTAAGNVIAQKIRLTTDLGSTELGLWPSLQRTRDNTWNGEKVDEYWHFVPLHPALNIRLDIVASTPEGDIGEAIMTRNETGWIQPLFHVYQNDKERSLGDLFLRHPQHPDLWKYHGRVDDLLTFLTTEKFHPAVAEQRIDAHPAVEECMLVGTRRPKAALIMRLKEGRTLEDVWGVVEEVNEEMPVYARVERGMVVLVKEPFLRTPKGTVSRGGMLKMYGREVDEVYGAAV
jgi:acyl-coenzyme A synthetase/AMP-(fatty) acid ligase